MSSSRLPGKVLLPFGESTVLQTIHKKCSCISGVKAVVILTSTEADDDKIDNIVTEGLLPNIKSDKLSQTSKISLPSKRASGKNLFTEG